MIAIIKIKLRKSDCRPGANKNGVGEERFCAEALEQSQEHKPTMASFLAAVAKLVDIELSPHFPVITVLNKNNQWKKMPMDDATIKASCY